MKVATITLNTAYDLVGRLDRINLGTVNAVETLGLFPAGKGINVAKVLNDLNIPVCVGGFLGKENQKDFEHMFASLKLEDKFQRVDGKTRINVKLTETDGDVTDFNFSGYQITPQDWQSFVANSLEYCQQFDLIAICGSIPKGISPKAFSDWLTQLTDLNIKVILDTNKTALTAGLDAKPWLIKPNQHELEELIGHELPNLSAIKQAAEVIRNKGIANVVVSLGAEGSLWLSDEGNIIACPPKCENIVSTVGAGDSMVAGLIYGLVNQLSQQDTLAFASAVSAWAVSQSNVGVTNPDLLKPILEKVEMTSI